MRLKYMPCVKKLFLCAAREPLRYGLSGDNGVCSGFAGCPFSESSHDWISA